MNLREAREAAERVSKLGTPMPSSDSIGFSQTRDMHALADYILATIDPSPELPITAEWLREEWGIDANGNHEKWVAYSSSLSGTFVFDNGCLRWWHDGHQTACLKTRQQFCDLCRALGIPRRKDGAK